MGHFHEEHKVPKRVEIQHRRGAQTQDLSGSLLTRDHGTTETNEGEALHTADPTPNAIQSTRKRGAAGGIKDP
jgi:hypothetical protein